VQKLWIHPAIVKVQELTEWALCYAKTSTAYIKLSSIKYQHPALASVQVTASVFEQNVALPGHGHYV
jgi:hypothetical protein